MAFANPLALFWGLLAVPIVWLYLLRIRVRREPVATDMLWQQVFAERPSYGWCPARSAWQRWRRPVSLAVQLTVLGLIVVALADPQMPGPRQIVLIVDNSASMGATDVNPTRLAEAKQVAARLVSGLRNCDQMAILSADDAVGVRCNFTSDQAALQETIDRVEITASGGSTQVLAAVELARSMFTERPSDHAVHGARWCPAGEIALLSDGCFDGAAELAAAEEVELIRVGKRTGNVALSRLAARRQPADPVQCQVFAEVRNFSDRPVECSFRIETAGGKAVAAMPLKLPRDGRWQEVFTLSAPRAERVSASLDPGDAYTKDDGAWLSVPPPDGNAPVVWPDVSAARSQYHPADAPGRSEGDLRAADTLGTDAAEVAAGRPGPPLWPPLVGCGVLLLALEWGLYQRRWIC